MLALWDLPSFEVAFDELLTGIAREGVWLLEPPPLASEEISVRLQLRLQHIYAISELIPDAYMDPLKALTEHFGEMYLIDGPLSESFEGQLIIIDLRALNQEECAPWLSYCRQLSSPQEGSAQLCVVLLCAEGSLSQQPNFQGTSWGERIKKIDSMIWADLHVKDAPTPLAEQLSIAVAVELCGWRLDLIQQLLNAGMPAVRDPLAWLNACYQAYKVVPYESSYCQSGRWLECPVRLCQRGAEEELENRLWRAHLTAIFPHLEERRQDLVSKYQHLLKIDDYQRKNGVRDLSELELGGISCQLYGKLPEEEYRHLMLFKEARNEIAHRRPASVRSINALLALDARSK